jgi:hypothetical protein
MQSLPANIVILYVRLVLAKLASPSSVRERIQKVCFEKKLKQKPPPERKNLLTYARGILLNPTRATTTKRGEGIICFS